MAKMGMAYCTVASQASPPEESPLNHPLLTFFRPSNPATQRGLGISLTFVKNYIGL